MGEWIFGCDVCQEVCPWNGDQIAEDEADQTLWPYLPEILSLTDEEFRQRFRRGAIKRTKREGMARNAAIALGNTDNPDVLPHLATSLESDPSAIVRAHVAWALGRIGGSAARAALERARSTERAAEVMSEIEGALAS